MDLSLYSKDEMSKYLCSKINIFISPFERGHTNTLRTNDGLK